MKIKIINDKLPLFNKILKVKSINYDMALGEEKEKNIERYKRILKEVIKNSVNLDDGQTKRLITS